VRFETRGATGLAGRHHHVEELAGAECLELLRRGVVADQRGDTASGAKRFYFGQDGAPPKGTQPLARPLEHPLPHHGFDAHLAHTEGLRGARDLEAKGVALEPAHGLVLVTEAAEEPRPARAEQRELGRHRELHRQRGVERAVEIDEPGFLVERHGVVRTVAHPMHRVLVTGAAGAIGRPVVEALRLRGHETRGFDLVASEGGVVGDLGDRDAVRRAMSGMDTVIHLGAVPNDAPLEALVGPNILGVAHVLDAAREHGVRRVVLASSIQVVGRPGPDRRLTAEDREPNNLYALTKLWAEELGGMAARVHGLSVVAARIGWMVRNEGEAAHMRERGWHHAYLSRGDVARFFIAAVEKETVPFAVMYVVGPEGADRWDLEPARRLFGWEPRDVFPEGLPFPAER